MTLDQAQALQVIIAGSHPLLPVTIHTLGSPAFPDYACFIVPQQYYLWEPRDWEDYRASSASRLYRFTVEGNRYTKHAQGKRRVNQAHPGA